MQTVSRCETRETFSVAKLAVMYWMPTTFHNVMLPHNVLVFVFGSGLKHRDFCTICIQLTHKFVRLPGLLRLWCICCGLYSVFGKSLCTYKRYWKWCPRTIVSKNWIKQLHTLAVLHFNFYIQTVHTVVFPNYLAAINSQTQHINDW
jgi:hypothetical protein